MGQFSWFTQDTHHRIVNGEEFDVVMSDDKGNNYYESCYEGYGEFGGKDYYVLMAEMNGFSEDDFKDLPKDKRLEELREKGIELAFDESPTGTSKKWKHPSITENGRYYGGVAPEPDDDQGFPMDEFDDYFDDNEEF